jgi:uncharacterized surface protein with fasciclin (FAS1) repeats
MMRDLPKKMMIATVTVFSLISASQIHAYCAKCVKIETDRAKDQALHPKPFRYYDDQVNVHDQQDPSKENREGEKSDSLTAENSPRTGSEELNGSKYRSATTETEKSSDSSKTTDPSPKSQENRIDHLLAFNFLQSSSLKEIAAETTSSKSNNYAPPKTAEAYSTIFTIFKTRSFLETLDGNFTLFIPTNNALKQLPEGMLADLIKPENAEKLAALVSNHLVPKKILPHQFADNNQLEVKTNSGKNLTLVTKGNKLYVDNIQILGAEAAGFDGVIYIIDKVLISQ